jgi:hypothetical protein
VGHRDADAAGLHEARRRQQHPYLRVVDVAVDGLDRRAERAQVGEDVGGDEVAGVQDEVGGPQALDARARLPRGKWVSEMTAISTTRRRSCATRAR